MLTSASTPIDLVAERRDLLLKRLGRVGVARRSRWPRWHQRRRARGRSPCRCRCCRRSRSPIFPCECHWSFPSLCGCAAPRRGLAEPQAWRALVRETDAQGLGEPLVSTTSGIELATTIRTGDVTRPRRSRGTQADAATPAAASRLAFARRPCSRISACDAPSLGDVRVVVWRRGGRACPRAGGGRSASSPSRGSSRGGRRCRRRGPRSSPR